MEQENADCYTQMAKKLELLEKVSVNTKAQIDFIKQRKFKGLLRLLNEREKYLEELVIVNQQVNGSQINKMAEQINNEELKQLLLLIDSKHQELIKDNSQAVEAANSERERILADLNRIRVQKRMRNSYDTRWVNFGGRRLNQQG